ncbi:MAG: hemolysin family protein [Acidobacteriia bacterium]|nr:hemolysin family protein [Terriglobia bacterium]
MSVLQLFLILLLLLLWSLIAIMEVALASFGKISARMRAEEARNSRNDFLVRLVERPEPRRIAISMGSQTCLVLMVYLLASFFFSRQLSFHLAFLATFGTLVFLILIFHHFLPRLIATRHPEEVLLRIYPLVHGFFGVTLPFARIILSTLALVEDSENTSRNVEATAEPQEIQALLDVGKEEGIIAASDGALIQSVVQFGTKMAKDSMTPRTEIVAIHDTATLEELQNLIAQRKHSRIPVFHEDIDNITGIVFIRDMLVEIEKGHAKQSVRTIVRPTLFVPETKPVSDLLKELQLEVAPMGIVIDEFGGVAGLITIEDLVEEIVGEIHDEDETPETSVIRVDHDEYIFSGRLPIGRVEELLKCEISDEDYSTIAGFVISNLGRVPSPGEKIELANLNIEILESTSQQIRRLRIARKKAAASAE